MTIPIVTTPATDSVPTPTTTALPTTVPGSTDSVAAGNGVVGAVTGSSGVIGNASPILRVTPSSDEAPRYLTREMCQALFARILELAQGGGETLVHIDAVWTGDLRWANNRIISSGDTRDTSVRIIRSINGAVADASTNKLDDSALRLALATAERTLLYRPVNPEASPMPEAQTYLHPTVWSDATYNLDAHTRADMGAKLVAPAASQGLLAAGYTQVRALTRAIYSTGGMQAHYNSTEAEYSVTVRNPGKMGSGWAGRSDYDWKRIDPMGLSDIALKKCVASANPRAIEPGHYTVIFEPQAVYDLISPVLNFMDRHSAESYQTPFTLSPGQSKIGVKMFDERVSISTDPMDPECGYIPFDYQGYPYRAAHWVQDGVLTALPYNKNYAITKLGSSEALLNPMAFRMRGGRSTIDDMIASTDRGLLVTRLSDVNIINGQSLLAMGTTRDGVWLINNGQITASVRNFRFNDSPLFALNSILEIGPAQRVFSQYPAIVPSLKVRDFNFNSLADAL